MQYDRSLAAAIAEGLMLRAGLIRREEAKLGAHFANYTLLDLARHCLRSAGSPDSGDNREVVGRALRMGGPLGRFEVEALMRKETITAGTADFPLILAAVAVKTLVASYSATPVHWPLWCAVASLVDFKETKRVELSDSGDLQLINELQPYEATGFADKAEVNRVFTYGRLFTLSRQAVINDDLNAFLEVPRAFGRKARVLPQKLALQKLLANPVLGTDKTAVFHAAHGNLSQAAAYALDTLEHAEAGVKNAVKLLRRQKAFVSQNEAASAEFMNLRPRVWLVNDADQFTALQVTQSAGALGAGQNAGVVNPVRDLQLQVVPEANLTNAAWGGSETAHFVLASPTEAPVIELAFLNGEQEPFLEEADQSNVDGRSFKVRLDVGCSAVGYKGAVKETGAAAPQA